MRVKTTGIAAACAGALLVATAIIAQPPTSAQSSESLPPEAIPIVCLSHYLRGINPSVFCRDHLNMLASSKENTRIPPPVPAQDAFVDFVSERAAKDAKLVLFRRSQWGNMVAATAADRKVHLFFDYRHMRAARFYAEIPDGPSIALEQVDGFLTLVPPPGVATLVLYTMNSKAQKRVYDRWTLDRGFADRDRVLR